MNKSLIHTFLFIASSTFILTSCGEDNTSFTTTGSTSSFKTGTVSSDNFTVLSSNLTPAIFADTASSTFTFTELDITVKIGDRNNQKLTDAHTVFFRTEWGLIEPSCVTVDGTCSVTWQTSSGGTAPADHKNTILAYTIGEESFSDINGNAIFDDADNDTPSFTDIEEPYIDSNENTMHDFGEPIVDVINGNDETGENGQHDFGDSFFNGNGCTHSSLCSETQKTIYIWDDVKIDMNGPPPATP